MNKLLRNPHFLMILYSVLVAGSFIIGHHVTVYMESRLLIFVRFLLASIVFGAYLGFRFGIKLPSIRDLLRYFAISFTLVFYFWGMFEALKYTSSLNTSILYTLVPMFSTFFGVFLLKEKPGIRKILVLILAMFGALWVISHGAVQTLLSLEFGKGETIYLFACIVMGMFSPLSKFFAGKEDTSVMTFWTLVTGTIILFFLAFPQIGKYNWREFPVELALGLLYFVFLTTIATFFIVQYSSRKMDVSKVMSYIYIIPVFVVVIQVLTGEPLPEAKVLPGILTAGICTFLFQKMR